MKPIKFQAQYREKLIALILNIQVNEFGININRADQPDLEIIEQFYQQNNGNFWIAIDDNQDVIGSLGLIDIGDNYLALRKMFVHEKYRGNDYNIAQDLLDNAILWAQERNIEKIFLGTTSQYHRAHRFYERNGFDKITPNDLPKQFPLVHVDNVFYSRKIK